MNAISHAKAYLVGLLPGAIQRPLRHAWWRLWRGQGRAQNVPVIRPGVLKPIARAVHADRAVVPGQLSFPDHRPAGEPSRLYSSLCRYDLLESQAFRHWATRLGEPWRPDRKLWEFCYVCQALYERGVLRPGAAGLGFAVGQEPLPSLFASFGCRIVATDLAPDDGRAADWAQSGQWLEDIRLLNARNLCDPQAFERLVTVQSCDMNRIPEDLRNFDFTWSSCSFEHCGDLEKGLQFLMNQMDCLKPGGVAVHTTEFNLSSNDQTLDEGVTVIYRCRDMESIVSRLRAAGHNVEGLDLALGDSPMDSTIDLPPYPAPYERKQHMRLVIRDWVATSVGLIITKRLD